MMTKESLLSWIVIFLLCEAQNLRIVNYLKTFATKHKWKRTFKPVCRQAGWWTLFCHRS